MAVARGGGGGGGEITKITGLLGKLFLDKFTNVTNFKKSNIN